MARLLILWTRPSHLSAQETEAWVREELDRFVSDEAIEGVELTRIRSGSPHHPQHWDWLLELVLRPGVDPSECTDRGACADWLADMRLLGMRPSVVAVSDEQGPGEEAGR